MACANVYALWLQILADSKVVLNRIAKIQDFQVVRIMQLLVPSSLFVLLFDRIDVLVELEVTATNAFLVGSS